MPFEPISVSELTDFTNNKLRTYHPQIMQAIKYGSELSQHLTVITAPQGDGEYALPNANISSVLQGFQKAFLPKGKVSFEAEKVDIQRVMLDHSFVPQDYYALWINHLEEVSRASGTTLTPAQYPLQQYIIDMAMKQAAEDEETLINIRGVYKARTANKVGKAEYSTNGVYTVLKKLIKQGKVKPVLVDSINMNDETEVYAFANDVAELVNNRYKMKEMKMFTPINFRRNYWRKVKDAYAFSIAERNQYDLRKNLPVFVDDTNIEVVGNVGMDDLKTVIITPKSNVFKVMGQYMTPLTAKSPYKSVDLSGDWGLGFGFALPEAVFVAGEIIEAPEIKEINTITATTARVKIRPVPYATAYRVDIDNNSDFSSPVVDNVAFSSIVEVSEDITIEDGNTSYEFTINSQALGTLTTATEYFVRVRAVMAVDAGTPYEGDVYTSANSAVVSFTTA
jgi:hypothetical protein